MFTFRIFQYVEVMSTYFKLYACSLNLTAAIKNNADKKKTLNECDKA